MKFTLLKKNDMIKELLEAVEAKRAVNKSTIKAEFARALVGKTLKAFGPNGKGLYGTNPDIK